jgi:hypothetical protein
VLCLHLEPRWATSCLATFSACRTQACHVQPPNRSTVIRIAIASTIASAGANRALARPTMPLLAAIARHFSCTSSSSLAHSPS